MDLTVWEVTIIGDILMIGVFVKAAVLASELIKYIISRAAVAP
jgi:hypothetical protein